MPVKFDKAYEEGMDILTDAQYSDGCMCEECMQDRKFEVLERAKAIVYPKFKGRAVDGISNLNKRGASSQLEFYYGLRCDNHSIRKNQYNKERRLFYCQWCGILHEAGERIDKKRYCGRCHGKLGFCDECGELGVKNRFRRALKGRKRLNVCMPCFVEKYEKCGVCGDGVVKGSVTKYVTKRDEREQIRYLQVCSACNKKGRKICSDCGDATHDLVCGSQGGRDLCPSCTEEEQGLMDYYYKPLKLWFKSDKKEGAVSQSAFYMGFELEIACNNSYISTEPMCHMIKELVGRSYVYTVHDGSIRENTEKEGLEAVSHPFTWQEYKKNGIPKWDELLLFLRAKGWKSNLDGVGFHVHTTKAAWGSHQIYKLLKFVYGNKKFIYEIAQRKGNKYTVMDKRDFDSAVLVAKDKKNRSQDHYNAINLNTNDGMMPSKTIEFRMFRGTLEPLFFHKNIEFVHSCYEFTKAHSVFDMGGINHYLKFITQHRRAYPCLIEFIQRRM